MTRTIRLFLLASAGSCSCLLNASVIFNDFFNGSYMGVTYTNSFNTIAGDTVSGLIPSFAFVSPIDQALAEVDFVTSIGNITDQNSVIISVSTAAGDLPDTLIESQQFDGMMGVLGSDANPPSILVWNPATQVDLVAGQTYWITLDAPGGDVVWNNNDQTSLGGAPVFGYYDLQEGFWQHTDNTLGAIEIQGGPETPEPSTMLMCAIGISGVLALRRRLAMPRY